MKIEEAGERKEVERAEEETPLKERTRHSTKERKLLEIRILEVQARHYARMRRTRKKTKKKERTKKKKRKKKKRRRRRRKKKMKKK